MRQGIRNTIRFQPEYHPYQWSHLIYLRTVTKQLTDMDLCVSYVSLVLCKLITIKVKENTQMGYRKET